MTKNKNLNDYPQNYLLFLSAGLKCAEMGLAIFNRGFKIPRLKIARPNSKYNNLNIMRKIIKFNTLKEMIIYITNQSLFLLQLTD